MTARLRHARLRRSRRDELRQGKIVRGADAAHFLRLLVRDIGQDHAVHPRFLEVRDKALKPIVIHHVDVAHADDGDLGVFADLLDDLKCLLHCHTVLQCLDTCRLNHGAIRHGIGERQAELDEIGARLLGTAYDVHGCLRAGAPCRHVDVKPCPSVGAKLCESFIHPLAHAMSSPSSFATICTSLSPRPERQTTTRSPALVCGISVSKYASACELSSAGMIPSMRERR